MRPELERSVTTNQVLLGVGLILALAVGGPPEPQTGDTMILLGPPAGGS